MKSAIVCLVVVVLCLAPAPALCTTSLEAAVSKTFNKLVEDGVWASTIGLLPNMNQGSLCTGNSDRWPTPSALPGSDLRMVLDRGSFICGYNSGGYYTTTDFDTGEQFVILDTRDPENINGLLYDWWVDLIAALGEYYNTDVKLEWKVLTAGSQPTLDMVNNGTYDAACGRWSVDAFYTDPYRGVLPRSLAFSIQHCASYLETSYIYTVKPSAVVNFNDLVSAINSGNITNVCTIGSRSGGTAQGCSALISQYSNVPFTCVGEGFAAFDKALTGECGAVWAGAPQDTAVYNRFPQPSTYFAGTLFRQTDLATNDDCPLCVCDDSGASLLAASFAAVAVAIASAFSY